MQPSAKKLVVRGIIAVVSIAVILLIGKIVLEMWDIALGIIIGVIIATYFNYKRKSVWNNLKSKKE